MSLRNRFIIAITIFILLLLFFIGSIIMYFGVKNKLNGQIDFVGSGVYVQADCSISGTENEISLPTLVIHEDTIGGSSWNNLDLVFDNEDSVIEIVINVVNNYTQKGNVVNLAFLNNSTKDNVVFEEFYYLNGESSSPTEFTQTTEIDLDAQESCSIVLRISIKDKKVEVKEDFAVEIVCTKVSTI